MKKSRNPVARALARRRPVVITPKKGKGSYKRQKAKVRPR